jgi:hypothetical protein
MDGYMGTAAETVAVAAGAAETAAGLRLLVVAVAAVVDSRATIVAAILQSAQRKEKVRGEQLVSNVGRCVPMRDGRWPS